MYEIEEIKSVLRRLGVKTSNQGYHFTAYGILLVLKNKDYLSFITKSLYIDIAIEFHTSWKCVERNIRTIVDSVWKTDNIELLIEICNGTHTTRPINKEFFELMYHYFEKLASEKKSGNEINPSDCCSKTGLHCQQLELLGEKLLSLQEENRHLNDTIAWMHDMIWELLKTNK